MPKTRRHARVKMRIMLPGNELIKSIYFIDDNDYILDAIAVNFEHDGGAGELIRVSAQFNGWGGMDPHMKTVKSAEMVSRMIASAMAKNITWPMRVDILCADTDQRDIFIYPPYQHPWLRVTENLGN